MGQQYSGVKRVVMPAAFVALTACGLGATSPAFAGPTISIDKDSFLWMAVLGRASFDAHENGAPNGTDWSKTFTTEEARAYFYAQAMKLGDKGDIAFELDIGNKSGETGNNQIHLLDGYTQFDFNDYAHVWVGRLIPPTDRASLDAPMYTSGFDFPIMAAW